MSKLKRALIGLEGPNSHMWQNTRMTVAKGERPTKLGNN